MSVAKRYMLELIDVPGLIRNLAGHRELVRTMTWRNFNIRYRGSFAGLFWSFLQPLVMMIVYTVVFSMFLKIRFSTDASPFTFSVYLLCGLLPWNAVSEGLGQSTGVIRANTNLVKRVVFPLEVLPINLALTAAIQQVIGFVLLVPLAWLVSGQLSIAIATVPFILALQLLFSIGLNWIIASLAVYLPDLGTLVTLFLTIWMFLTPIFYPEDVVPREAAFVFLLNPMAQLVRFYRDAFMRGGFSDFTGLGVTFVFSLFVFLFGYFWFMHTKKGFADVL